MKKGSKNDILNKMNECDRSLKLTVEPMANNKSIFFSETVCLENEDLTLQFYRKASASNCLTNYKTTVSPKSY